MMNATPIVVKQELDVESEDVGGATLTNFDMKSESQISITNIAETSKERFPTKLITSTAAECPDVKSEPLEQHVFDGEISPLNNLGESFLIYELEEVPKIAPATTTTITKPIIINSKLRKKRILTKSNKIQSSISAKRPALETEVTTTIAKTTTTPVAAATTTTTSTSTKPLSLSTNKPATIELKVKCLCRLGNPVAASATNVLNLKNFFDEMFNVTRQLSRVQQREVKMALLKAISEAEEHFDAGRWCDKCCS